MPQSYLLSAADMLQFCITSIRFVSLRFVLRIYFSSSSLFFRKHFEMEVENGICKYVKLNCWKPIFSCLNVELFALIIISVQ